MPDPRRHAPDLERTPPDWADGPTRGLRDTSGPSDFARGPERPRERPARAGSTPQTLQNVEALRGVAVLLVVLFHLYGMETHYVAGVHLLPTFLRMGRGGVDLFFVISGVVMVVSTRGRPGEPGRFLLRRVLRIYPLYWFFSLLTLTVYVLPAAAENSVWRDANLLASFLLWPQEKAPLLSVGWTLWHELYFYLVFAALIGGRRPRLVRGVVAWSAFVAVGGLAYATFIEPAGWPLLRIATDPLTFEFVAGCLIGWRLGRGGLRGGAAALLCGIGLGCVAAVVYPEGLTDSLPDRWARAALLGVPAALVVYGAVALDAERGWRFPRWLVLVGAASYSIYLSHMLVLAVGRRAWFLVVPNGHVASGGVLDGADNVVAIAVLLAAVLATGAASYRLLERPLMQRVRQRLRRPTPAR